MRPRRPLPDPLHERPFSVAEALSVGVTAKRLRGTDLAQPFRGARAIGSGDDTLSRARRYAVRMPGNQFFSHVTAAYIHGMRLPHHASSEPLHVGVVWPRRSPRVAGVVGHEMRPPVAVVHVGGLRTVPPVVAWCQLAAVLTPEEVIVAGDGLIRRQDPVSDLESLHHAVRRWTGAHGAPALRAALPHLRAGTDSARETMLRLLMSRAGLPEPQVNPPILDSAGRFLAYGDLVYAERRVLVEYDGEQHRLDAEQYQKDVDRLDRLMEEGWRVIRVNRAHMRRRARAALVLRIERALHDADGRDRAPIARMPPRR